MKKIIRATVIVLFLLVCNFSYAIATQCPDELLNKKIAVIIGSRSGNVAQDALQQIISTIEDMLMEYGFSTVDQDKLRKLIPEEQKKLILSGDTVGAIRLSDEFGADMFLLGNVSIREKKIPGYETGIHSVFLTISLKLMGAHNAKVIATGILSKKSAGVDTLETVLKILNRNLKPVLDKIYGKYCKNGKSIFIAPSEETGVTETTGGQKQKEKPAAGGVPQIQEKSSLEDL